MRFVHSLVKGTRNGRQGWLVPVEMGEEASHYISFVIPVENRPDYKYTCEIVKARGLEREIVAHEVISKGKEAYVLAAEGLELVFSLTATGIDEPPLPYVGELEHPDFELPFIEIEPDDPAILDRLFMEHGVGILGCDPFQHYVGAEKLMVR